MPAIHRHLLLVDTANCVRVWWTVYLSFWVPRSFANQEIYSHIYSRHMKSTCVAHHEFLACSARSQLVCITASSAGGLVGIGARRSPGDGTGTSST